MTLAEYQKRQRKLGRYSLHVQAQFAKDLRGLSRAMVARVAQSVLAGKTDRESIVRAMGKDAYRQAVEALSADAIGKPALACDELHKTYLADAAAEAGVPIPELGRGKHGVKNRRIVNARAPFGKTTKPGRLFRRGADGKIEWLDNIYTMAFFKRFDLSTSVWNNVEEQEERILEVINGGRAMARDPVAIAKDLEVFVNYENGGARVIGRWGKLISAYNADGTRNEERIHEGWQREYLRTKGLTYWQYEPNPQTEPVEYAEWLKTKNTLESPLAEQWIKEHSKGKRGRELLPPAARNYSNRIGKAGLDYRAIRVVRTQMQFTLQEEEKEWARSVIGKGTVKWVLEPERDHWGCQCEKYAGKEYPVEELPPVPHPNCNCRFEPAVKTQAELAKELGAKIV
jgi:hypothetical protein